MKMYDVVVFGYNEFAKEIVHQVRETNRSVVIYALKEAHIEEAEKDGIDVKAFDLDDGWDDFKEYKMKETLFICALEDDASNVYLTIGLRDALKDVRLVALASTQEHASKLRLAGANKVISKLQVTADVIIEVLEKPIVTRIIQEILQERSDLNTVQITLEEGSPLLGRSLYAVSLQQERELIVLAVVDEQLQTHFIFTSKGHNHMLKAGDILVVIGYDGPVEKLTRRVE